MGNYRRLEVWKKAHALTLELYRLSELVPRSEIFGLTSQLRRAAASIGANLAEGSGRYRNPKMVRFTRIAAGSSNELDYHLLLAKDLGYLRCEDYERVCAQNAEVGRMLSGLAKQLRNSEAE